MYHLQGNKNLTFFKGLLWACFWCICCAEVFVEVMQPQQHSHNL